MAPRRENTQPLFQPSFFAQTLFFWLFSRFVFCEFEEGRKRERSRRGRRLLDTGGGFCRVEKGLGRFTGPICVDSGPRLLFVWSVAQFRFAFPWVFCVRPSAEISVFHSQKLCDFFRPSFVGDDGSDAYRSSEIGWTRGALCQL